MPHKIRRMRVLADLMTVSRVFLAVCLAVLGFTRGGAALPTVALLLLLSWTTDLVDGPLARLDKDPQISWVGKHDAEADLSTSFGVTAYLVFSGYMASWMGAALVIVMLVLWVVYSHEAAWPLYVVPYVVLMVVTFQGAPLHGWLIVAYLLFCLKVYWSRLLEETLPQFFGTFKRVRKRE